MLIYYLQVKLQLSKAMFFYCISDFCYILYVTFHCENRTYYLLSERTHTEWNTHTCYCLQVSNHSYYELLSNWDFILYAANLQKYWAVYYLEWLYEGIKKDSNAYASSQQFYESGCPKKFQKTNGNQLRGINDTSNNGYKIKYVPRIFEVVL